MFGAAQSTCAQVAPKSATIAGAAPRRRSPSLPRFGLFPDPTGTRLGAAGLYTEMSAARPCPGPTPCGSVPRPTVRYRPSNWGGYFFSCRFRQRLEQLAGDVVDHALVKLRVERLPIGADAGIADKAFFGISFGHILRQT